MDIPFSKGVSNHQGSDATESRRIMRAVAEVLRAEGKYFVDSKTTPNSVAVQEMERAGVPVSARNVFIDFEDEAETIEKQVALLARTARENGVAVGVGHPRKNTLRVLREQIPLLERQGFNLVLSSAVVQ
ncbi:MAG: divergent polysaccharide deacetylase family protein [Fidelibacterota bacterium]